jgi:hypothetical protein
MSNVAAKWQISQVRMATQRDSNNFHDETRSTYPWLSEHGLVGVIACRKAGHSQPTIATSIDMVT